MQTYPIEGGLSTVPIRRQPRSLAPARRPGTGEVITLKVSIAPQSGALRRHDASAPADHADGRTMVRTFRGRAAWALAHLISAGKRGCTAINTPGPRWSDYVFKIRKAGLAVETVDETHGGAFAGRHARYVLRSPVTVLSEVRA